MKLGFWGFSPQKRFLKTQVLKKYFLSKIRFRNLFNTFIKAYLNFLNFCQKNITILVFVGPKIYFLS